MKDEKKKKDELVDELVEMRQRIIQLESSEAQRRQVEDERMRLAAIVESSDDAIIGKTLDGIIVSWNSGAEKIYGYAAKEIKGRPVSMLILPDRPDEASGILKRVARGERVEHYETVCLRKDGKHFDVSITTSPIKDKTGKIIGASTIARDITRRKKAEEQVRASLREKEVLLREIHHRIKNNLQIVSSLLNLQSRYVKDKQVFEMLREGQNRIKSMALIHEKLYQSKDLAKIDFAEYIQNLTTSLYRSYRVKPNDITLKIKVDNVLLGVDAAIPCGLIIDELVSNSLKYAFPGDRKGEIRISLCSDNDNKTRLIVSDNGIGLPKDLDFRNTTSLGLQLLVTLADQLEGTLELDRSGGTKFRIMFTPLRYKKEGQENGK